MNEKWKKKGKAKGIKKIKNKKYIFRFLSKTQQVKINHR